MATAAPIASLETTPLKAQDFHYELPAAQIARHPPPSRTAARLLHLDGRSGGLADHQIPALPALLRPGDLLVLNDTRVIPARLRGHKDTGGQVEILVERIGATGEILAQVGASKPLRPGARVRLAGGYGLECLRREPGGFAWLRPLGEIAPLALLAAVGEIPLPPYLGRAPEAADAARYQTVYARAPGAVAAPTAGLHFDAELLAALQARGVETAFCTLHVGAGTFQPIRVDDLRDHRMHAEHCEVSPALCAAVAGARARGGRVVAVGTTAVRALESAAAQDAAAGGLLAPLIGDTRLFITPGFRFRVVDLLLTNFHLPGSTLLVLVAAFAGRERVLAAYRHAIAAGYRFYSYGDAMLISPDPAARPEADAGKDAA